MKYFKLYVFVFSLTFSYAQAEEIKNLPIQIMDFSKKVLNIRDPNSNFISLEFSELGNAAVGTVRVSMKGGKLFSSPWVLQNGKLIVGDPLKPIFTFHKYKNDESDIFRDEVKGLDFSIKVK